VSGHFDLFPTRFDVFLIFVTFSGLLYDRIIRSIFLFGPFCWFRDAVLGFDSQVIFIIVSQTNCWIDWLANNSILHLSVFIIS